MSNIFSIILRIVAIFGTALSGGYITYLLFSLSSSPWSTSLYILPGPLLITIGIILSFLSRQRPALLRLETAFGLLLTYVGGIFGAFSIGGILISGLLVTAPVLLIDGLLFRIANAKTIRPKINVWHKVFVILFQFAFTFILLMLVASQAIGFFTLILPVALIWNVLLFLSIQSYLPKQKMVISAISFSILLLMGSLIAFKSAQADISATISETTNSYSSSGINGTHKALGSESGGTGSENVDFEYQELNKHKDDLSFDFNDITYLIKPSTRVVFYGLLSNKKAKYIKLKLKNGLIIKGKVAHRQFVLQTHKLHAQKYLQEVVLTDGQKIILKEKIEPLDDFEDFEDF